MGQGFSPETRLGSIIYFNISSSSGRCIYSSLCFSLYFSWLRVRVTVYMNRVTNLGYLTFCVLSCLWASVLHYSWGCFNGFLEVLHLLFLFSFLPLTDHSVMALKSPCYLFSSLDQPAVFPEVIWWIGLNSSIWRIANRQGKWWVW